MATIHFVKDGKTSTGERLTKSVNISAERAAETLGSFEAKHTKAPPTINPEVRASHTAPYNHVVLEVGSDDVSEFFTQKEFYYLIGLTPQECIRLTGISVTEG